MYREKRAYPAFTLTELLVVLGIITLLIGILLPIISSARASSYSTRCMNNLRQLGNLYTIYAHSNEDRVPLGVPDFGFYNDLPYPQLEKSEGPRLEFGYLTARNHYVWVRGAPSAGAGPLVLDGTINRGNAKILYCPADLHGKEFKFDTPQNPWVDRVGPNGFTVMDYAVRPVIGAVWAHGDVGQVEYPYMPRLFRQNNFALIAELPQVPPANHGSGAHTYINVLYGDSSVRSCEAAKYAAPLKHYLWVPKDVQPGGWKVNEDDRVKILTSISSTACISNDPNQDTIWRTLDRN